MKSLILILLLISSFHFVTSTKRLEDLSEKELRALITIIKEEYSFSVNEKVDYAEDSNENIQVNPNDHVDIQSSNKLNNNIQVDPNDHVDIALWNKLNDQDIKNMPEIKDYADEATATRWLEWYLRVTQRFSQIGNSLEYDYLTNITTENAKKISDQSLLQTPFGRQTLPIAKEFNKYMKNSKNKDLKLIFGRLATGTMSHNDKDVKRVSKLSSDLESIYGTATVCELNDKKTCHTIEPYLERLMETEKDYDRLLWAWKGWHDECGNKVRPVYLEYVDLLNKNVKENGYDSLADNWIEDYEMGNSTEFENTVDQILKDIMPLYTELHAYVRGRLCSMYPNRFDCHGPIPAHLLGNMWAQQWHDRLNDVLPYPDAPPINLTLLLQKKKFSVHDLYTTSEDFFTSIGLYPMTPKFWARSMFEKPKDRDVVCHAAAFDLGYHDDYRAKVCTEVNDDYFYTIHHEMGHIEYYMAYAEGQPFVYRDGANSAFHEAIGDTIGMYAISPAHLVKLGFVDKEAINQHYEINYLMRLALQKVAFAPFAYVMDKYRFLLFRDKIDRKHELNTMWWALRIEHGGIMAAAARTDKVNFDPGAKYHVPSNVPYMRYFLANILQFQFYRGLCRIKGQTTKLHLCDIYGNKEAGQKFKEMLAMGSSKPWSQVLQSLTGETKVESKAVLDFFEPLYKWLKAENLARGYPVGWM
ncbi:unnamed protein product [Adineta steineri]|uniref:Angiotensin-converting enzyme n=4 Tax=Adineta steineri TaxID=433720 RepID=A0A814LQQ2_9BILA|nr:unnamed protein product [Adineta steineri]CAF1149700.1 unnamed protein product [Adineta steineri]CAF3920876.1 unnamed protein product [Adineta steineri]